MEPVGNRVTNRVDRAARVRRIGADLRATTLAEVDADKAVTSAQTSTQSHSRHHEAPDAELDPRSGAAGDPLQAALLEAMQAGLNESPRSEAARLRKNAYAGRPQPAPAAAQDDVTA